MANIAAAHPGKIGDVLYCLPALRQIAKRHGPVDFYTSSYCAGLKCLFESQSCIRGFYVRESYVMVGNGPGFQPWRVPVPKMDHNKTPYDRIYQMGYRSNPDRFLPDWISSHAGVDPSGVYYDIEYARPYDAEYIVIAPRGQTDFAEQFQEAATILSERYHVIQVGGPGEDLEMPGRNLCGLDFLSTLGVIKHASGFIGLMSSMLVLSNGFDHPKIIPHNGTWDMRHIMRTENHTYLLNPTGEDIANAI